MGMKTYRCASGSAARGPAGWLLRPALFLSLFPVILAACGSTELLPGEYDDADLAGRTGVLRLKGNAAFPATLEEITADSISYLPAQSTTRVSVPRRQVLSFSYSDYASSVGLGAAGGLLLGGGVGALIGLAGEQESEWVDVSETAIAGAIGAGVGLLLGVGNGIANPHVTTYQVTPGGRETDPGGDTPPAGAAPFVTMEVPSLLAESDSEIEFVWMGRPVTLPKEGIQITRAEGVVRIRVPRAMYEGISRER